MKKCCLALVLAALVAAPRAIAAEAGQSSILERILVRVNGEVFTQSQLTERQINSLRQDNRQVADPKALEDDATLRTALNQITPRILVQAVDELLLVQRARELNAQFTDADFKAALDSIKKDNKLDDASFAKALADEGITLDELRTNLERAALIRAVQNEEIYPHMTVTEEELRQYYAAHNDEFMTPATVTLRELLVSVPNSTQNGQSLFSVGDDNAARAKVQALRDRAVKGEDFEKLVREASEAPTKDQGGLIGPVKIEDLNPALKDVLDKMQPGDVSEAIRVPTGYQLLKLEARNEPTLQPFTEVHDQIEQHVRSARLGGETEKLLTRLRQQAVIEWKDQAFKDAYEKELAKETADAAAAAAAPVNTAAK
jgi:peptidyl-prolyl cis-trans isomerase SurA